MDTFLWFLYTFFVLAAFYNYSTTCNFYIKMGLFWFCILLNGALCTVLLIPSYIRGGGADTIFKCFYYWTLWMDVEIQVRGYEENLKNIKGAAVVIANHQTSLDILTMNLLWPKNGVGMIKKSLMYVPIFNTAAFFSRSIAVDRMNRMKALVALDHCLEEVKKFSRRIWIFPEGTRNQSGTMLPFKKGAFNIAVRAQIPIIPVVISDYRPFYMKKDHIFRDGGVVISEVLPAISTQGLTEDDVGILAESVREQMLEVYERNSAETRRLMQATVNDIIEF